MQLGHCGRSASTAFSSNQTSPSLLNQTATRCIQACDPKWHRKVGKFAPTLLVAVFAMIRADFATKMLRGVTYDDFPARLAFYLSLFRLAYD